MENQQVTNTNIPVNTSPGVPQVTFLPVKTNLVMPILLSVLISAGVFGFGGYYLGTNRDIVQTQQSSKVEIALFSSPTPVSDFAKNQGYLIGTNSEEVITFFSLPEGWISSMNEAKTSKDCYRVAGQKIGKINQPIKDYFMKEYNYDTFDEIDKMLSLTPQYNWQGIESYTFPGIGIGEVKTLYIQPAQDQWYKIAIYYEGPGEGVTLPAGFSCDAEQVEVETVVKNIRFL